MIIFFNIKIILNELYLKLNHFISNIIEKYTILIYINEVEQK